MKKLLSFSEFHTPQTNENLVEEETLSPLSEAVKEFQTIAKSSSKADFKKQLQDKLTKHAPSLAGDENFMSQLADSYTNSEAE